MNNTAYLCYGALEIVGLLLLLLLCNSIINYVTIPDQHTISEHMLTIDGLHGTVMPQRRSTEMSVGMASGAHSCNRKVNVRSLNELSSILEVCGKS